MNSGESSSPTQVVDGARMRTLADALAELEEKGGLVGEEEAEIRVGLMQLPDGTVAGTVALIGPDRADRCAVMLPSSVAFSAKNTIGERHRYHIDELHGATSDLNGNVQLSDGSHVHAVELETVRLVAQLTEAQEELLRCVLKALGYERECLRAVDEELLPGMVALDYAAIARLGAEKLPSLKAIENELRKYRADVPRQTLANVLALAGFRRPRSGARARRKPA